MRATALLLLLGACEPTTPQGVFQPRRVEVATAPAPDEDVVVPDDDTGDEDAEADADAEVEDLSPEELAAAMGLSPDEPLVPEIGPPGEKDEIPDLAPAPTVMAPPPVPRWDPSQALDGSWGIRLVSTTSMAQPPRAMLGLPNGREEAVKPGDLLPEAGVVVLGIGRDIVQIAQITPQGDHARVDSQTLRAMYPEGQGGFGR